MSNRFYGEANDETKLVTKLYGGSSNGAVRINKLYGPVNQTLLTFTNPTNVSVNKKIFLDKTTDAGMTDFNGRIEMLRPSGLPTLISILNIHPSTGSIISLKEAGLINSAKAVALLSEWGIYTTTSYLDSLSQGNAYYTLSSFTSTTGFGTKLIHQGFGHVDYGEVIYYTNSAHTTTATLRLRSQSSVNKLFFTSQGQQKTIEGVTLAASDVKEVILTHRVTSLPYAFLGYCSSLDKLDISTAHIYGTNDYFLQDCTAFNAKFDFPAGLTSIGYGFMKGCTSFNKDIVLPSTLAQLGTPSSFAEPNFMRDCDSMTSEVNVGALSTSIIVTETGLYSFSTTSNTVPAYTTGIKIAGSNRAAWMSFFPNRASSPYRKLIDAGY